MSLELTLLAGLTVPGFFFLYMGFQLEDRHSVLRMFLTGMSSIFIIPSPLVTWLLARKAGYANIEGFSIGFILAAIVTFVIIVFYLIWLYVNDTGKAMSSFDRDPDPGM